MADLINFGDLLKDAGGAFEPLPKGSYDVIVSGAEAAQSSTQKLMFKVVYKVVGGPYNGRTIYNNITLSTDNPNALRMFFMNMKAMGLTEEFFASSPAPSAVADALVNKSCNVTIDHREWQGQMRENVKSLKAATGISVGPAGITAGPSVPTPAAVPAAPPVAPAPAPAPVAAPATPPPAAPAAPVVATPEPVAEPVQAPPAAPEPAAPAVSPAPAGYEAIWDTMPQAAKDAILASAAPATVAEPAAPAGGIVPPPPVVF